MNPTAQQLPAGWCNSTFGARLPAPQLLGARPPTVVNVARSSPYDELEFEADMTSEEEHLMQAMEYKLPEGKYKDIPIKTLVTKPVGRAYLKSILDTGSEYQTQLIKTALSYANKRIGDDNVKRTIQAHQAQFTML